MQKIVESFFAVGQVEGEMYILITPQQAIEKYLCSEERIRQMIYEDKLIAIKKFNRWWIADTKIKSLGLNQRQDPP